MAYKVSLSPKAYTDIAEAFEYYQDSIQTLLNFDKELLESYKTISLNPYFRRRYKNINGYPLKKFHFCFYMRSMKLKRRYISTPFSIHILTLKNIRVYNSGSTLLL